MKNRFERIRSTAPLIAALAASVICMPCAQADDLVDPRAVLREARQFLAPDAVKDDKFVPIGGIDQWISVRGRHRDAPFLLFLHGGPGFTSIPNSYLYTAEWQEYFNVVQWDQRGAGKTFGRNPGLQPASLSIERALKDAEEVAAYVRKTYGRQKIVLLGHSWGSILGVKLAQLHPDWFHAYVGIGQATDARASETMGYQATLAAALAANDTEAIKDLKEIAPYPSQDPAADLAHLGRERKWLARYGGAVWRNTEAAVDAAGMISPDYTAADWTDRERGLDLNLAGLWGEITKVNLFSVKRIDCPVILFEGRHDLNVNAQLAERWLRQLEAPVKKLVWFEDSAHGVFDEEPGKTLVTLQAEVLPLAK
ncbi:alpha/beta hydrolase [Massilia agilis]|uniref:Proline iminopeptidase n=1 Tax=Massilia agilis TaxID=1811226 RepID=A0ABT2DE95_9BURK|nr:alpha/beta hydrolase [Massilia agilis]MCS0809634.1 alpha/beta hydrolase [Massilia agilis]